MQLSFLETRDARNDVNEGTFLKSQLITYIGNKRALLGLIGNGFEQTCKRHCIANPTMLDLFAGSGVVSRLMKLRASFVWSNDIEFYSRIVNKCHLTNPSDFDIAELQKHLNLIREAAEQRPARDGFVRRLYAPKNPELITKEDRVFYTIENAEIIDSCAPLINEIPSPYSELIMGPFLSYCSKHVNTSGVFKGFYKNSHGVGQYGGNMRNALSRILKRIQIEAPILIERHCSSQVSTLPAEKFVENMDEVDIAYLDPPYNQHPYGSN